jgi:hypothetical protein
MLPTKRADCSEARSWALVKQKARPRLRSMKSSGVLVIPVDYLTLLRLPLGRHSEGNTNYVLELRLGDAEVIGDIRECVARHEAID